MTPDRIVYRNGHTHSHQSLAAATYGTTIECLLSIFHCQLRLAGSIKIIGMFKNNLSEIGLSYVARFALAFCFAALFRRSTWSYYYYESTPCIAVTAFVLISVYLFRLYFAQLGRAQCYRSERKIASVCVCEWISKRKTVNGTRLNGVSRSYDVNDRVLFSRQQ